MAQRRRRTTWRRQHHQHRRHRQHRQSISGLLREKNVIFGEPPGQCIPGRSPFAKRVGRRVHARRSSPLRTRKSLWRSLWSSWRQTLSRCSNSDGPRREVWVFLMMAIGDTIPNRSVTDPIPNRTFPIWCSLTPTISSSATGWRGISDSINKKSVFCKSDIISIPSDRVRFFHQIHSHFFLFFPKIWQRAFR